MLRSAYLGLMKPYRAILVLLILWSSLSLGSAQGGAQMPLPLARPVLQSAALTPEILTLRQALKFANKGKWDDIQKLFGKQTPAIHQKILTWLRLTDPRGKSHYSEITAFLTQNPDWPWRLSLRRRAEAIMPASLPPAQVIAWLTEYQPLSVAGKRRLIAAYQQHGLPKKVRALVRQTWHQTAFIRRQEKQFYQRYRQYLTADDHWRRFDHLMWRGQHNSAQRASWYLPADRRKLADARLKLRRQAAGVDQAIRRVPPQLQQDAGLIYERVRWRRKRQLTDGAFELLRTAPAPHGFARKWWIERRIIIRRLLRQSRPRDAYIIAANHHQKSGASFAEAEWLAGWIALNHLTELERGLRHFEKLGKNVTTPISLARAYFWAGRTLGEMGRHDDAQQQFEKAAIHTTTYYGQLAAQRLNHPQIMLPIQLQTPLDQAFKSHELVKATRALAATGDRELTEIFFRALMRAHHPKINNTQLAQFGHAIKRPDLAVYSARQSARKGQHLIENGYPQLSSGLRPAPRTLEPALLHGLIRQESAFDSRAISRVGARGLMQLMPATAQQIARKTKLVYRKDRLLNDPGFNLSLGQRYLEDMIKRFDGAYPLAIAAYNAGPHRVKRWLKSYGDPRTEAITMIDWVESIPFSETRNYVQRVLEATVVYRHKQDMPGNSSQPYLTAQQWCLLACQLAAVGATPPPDRPEADQ